MKKIFVLFVFFLTGYAFSQEPVMTFENTMHDFGKIKKGTKVSCEFVFTNTGKAPLFLSEPRSTCGCTVPSYPKEPIMPGQKNKIVVTYDAEEKGTFTKYVTVFSNAENSPVVLVIKGEVVP